MKQFELQNNLLKLRVKKSPTFIRGFYFFLTFGCFISPTFGIIVSAANGGSFHLGFFVMIFIFALLGFFLLRSSLWNTFGEELIEFNQGEITYEANYGWFKDGKKTLKMDALIFSIRTIGYEDEKLGTLTISGGEITIESTNELQLDQLKSEGNILIESVVKMPIDQLEELIELLEIKFRMNEVK